jgi:hypothetical protein
MRWNDPKDSEATERKEFLRSRLEQVDQDSRAAGVIRQVLAQGEDTLTNKQSWVYENEVVVDDRCNICSQSIPDTELAASFNNGGICGWCEHQKNKDD